MFLSTTDFLATGENLTGRGWVDRAFRVCLSFGLLYAAYLVTAQAIAEWHYRQGSAQQIQKAIEWDPGKAEYYVARARALQVSLEWTDINEVVRLYETATRLSPSRASYWAELGGSYEWAGREEEARRAYERAQQLFPNSSTINWKLGNFYIRAGRVAETLQAFEKALLGDPEMRQPAFDLVWRAGIDSRLILAKMIPADTRILFAYLNYLVEKQHLDEAGQVWARLLEHGHSLDFQSAFPYLDGLIEHQRVDELRAAWAALMDRSRSGIHPRRFDPNRITNGGFEDEILNGGLEWRVTPVEGVVVSGDNLIFFDGTRSLKLHFDGKHNVDYSHVSQYVPVALNTMYRFVGYLRAQNVTTDSGPRFEIYDARDRARLSVSTEGAVGTFNWSPQQLQFRTGPDTQLLVVRVVRPASRKFDNAISGTVWIDRLSLNAVE